MIAIAGAVCQVDIDICVGVGHAAKFSAKDSHSTYREPHVGQDVGPGGPRKRIWQAQHENRSSRTTLPRRLPLASFRPCVRVRPLLLCRFVRFAMASIRSKQRRSREAASSAIVPRHLEVPLADTIAFNSYSTHRLATSSTVLPSIQVPSQGLSPLSTLPTPS